MTKPLGCLAILLAPVCTLGGDFGLRRAVAEDQHDVPAMQSREPNVEVNGLRVEFPDVEPPALEPRDAARPVGVHARSAIGVDGVLQTTRDRSPVAMVVPHLLNATERSVYDALQWLADHQLPDGGWSFDHRQATCPQSCDNPGSLKEARNAATALALLPFLGAGNTHTEGQYKTTINRGLSYLTQDMRIENGVGSLEDTGGGPYSHALATIAISEAYAMTHDKALMQPAQAAVNHIVKTQDAASGGWRYKAGQPCNLGLTGWNLLALKSAYLAYLQVPPKTVKGAMKFLDSMQSDDGAAYGYAAPGDEPAATAVGLLCRMYLGWKRDDQPLTRGVERLSRIGPSKDDLFYDFFAYQVMRHSEGSDWTAWHKQMRDHLIATQDKSGHQQGSWYFPNGDRGAQWGGRLYCTAMSAMILEVYYRHLPIYGKQAVEETFPIK